MIPASEDLPFKMKTSGWLLAVALSVLLAGCGGSNNGGGGGGGGTVSILISPTTASVPVNGTQQFTATVSGSSNTSVTWTASAGSVSSTGLYTAPGAVPTPNPVTVTATSQADTTKSATGQVTITAPPPPVSKQAVSVTAGQTTSNVNIAVQQLTPTLQLSALGIGSSAGGTAITVKQGESPSLLVVGKGVVQGTFYQVSGPGDVQVTQPSPSDFCTTTDSTPCVNVTISVSATATLGARDLLVENGAGEVSVFPGGVMITQGP